MRNIIYLLFCIIYFTLPLTAADISGTVTDSGGESLGSVTVCTMSWLCVKTNSNGEYRIDNSIYSSFIRFSRNGYKSITLKIADMNSNININVALKKAELNDKAWIIPECSANIQAIKNSIGSIRLKVVLPDETTVLKSKDVDYEMVSITHNENGKTDYLIYMEGPTASSGVPSWADSLTIVHDRNVTFKRQKELNNGVLPSSFIDIKAHSKNGKFWRFIGDAFEFITYENVSESSAAIFDEIIKTLCVIPQNK